MQLHPYLRTSVYGVVDSADRDGYVEGGCDGDMKKAGSVDLVRV